MDKILDFFGNILPIETIAFIVGIIFASFLNNFETGITFMLLGIWLKIQSRND